MERGGAGHKVEGSRRQVDILEGLWGDLKPPVMDRGAQEICQAKVRLDRHQKLRLMGQQGGGGEPGTGADLEDIDTGPKSGA